MAPRKILRRLVVLLFSETGSATDIATLQLLDNLERVNGRSYSRHTTAICQEERMRDHAFSAQK